MVPVEDAPVRPMMGLDVPEPLPARFPYRLSDPFILVHEATVPITPEWAQSATPPTRTAGSTTSGTSSRVTRAPATARAPAGRERARPAVALLKVRTGRGVWHAESIGADQVAEGVTGEFRSVLFWVNLARKDKQAEPTAQVLEPNELPRGPKPARSSARSSAPARRSKPARRG